MSPRKYDNHWRENASEIKAELKQARKDLEAMRLKQFEEVKPVVARIHRLSMQVRRLSLGPPVLRQEPIKIQTDDIPPDYEAPENNDDFPKQPA